MLLCVALLGLQTDPAGQLWRSRAKRCSLTKKFSSVISSSYAGLRLVVMPTSGRSHVWRDLPPVSSTPALPKTSLC